MTQAQDQVWKNVSFEDQSSENQFNEFLKQLDFGLVKPTQITARVFNKTAGFAILMSNGDNLVYGYQERPHNGFIEENQFILNTHTYDFEGMSKEEYEAAGITAEQTCYDAIIQLYTADLKQRLSRRNWT